MWMRSSRRWPNRCASPRNSWLGLIAPLLLLSACGEPKPARAQIVVYDPQNYVENALAAARQLESLSHQAVMLANQARELAASPYSHLAETSQALGDIAELAQSVRGVAADVDQLQGQFEDLYPTAVEGLDPRTALARRQGRLKIAHDTAEDLARTAADLERLSRGRGARLAGAVSASQAASGQTAAIQSSTQVLGVLSEDLASMRTILLAQSRLMAEEAARRAAERAASAEARRRFWDHEPGRVPPPDFDPYAPRN
jgi:P-type conjugative transfer protein TrbJ